MLCGYSSLHGSQTVLEFYTEHGSITAVLCTKFQNGLTAEMYIMDARDSAIFKFI